MLYHHALVEKSEGEGEGTDKYCEESVSFSTRRREDDDVRFPTSSSRLRVARRAYKQTKNSPAPIPTISVPLLEMTKKKRTWSSIIGILRLPTSLVLKVKNN